MSRPNFEPAPPLRDFREEIALAQLRALYELGGRHADRRLLKRLATVYYDHIKGKSWRQKKDFFLFYASLLKRRFAKAQAGQGVVPEAPNRLRIAVTSHGALGDFLQQMPFVEAFYLRFAPLQVDFFVSGEKLDQRSQLAVSGFPFIGHIRTSDLLPALRRAQAYDLLIDIRHLPRYEILDRGKIAALNPAMLALIDAAEPLFRPYDFFHAISPALDGLFGRLMAAKGLNAIATMGHFGHLPLAVDMRPSFRPDPAALAVINRLGLAGKRYVILHDGFEAGNIDHHQIKPGQRVTRSWPLEHWAACIRLMKAQMPDLLFAQIGLSKTAGRIAGVDLDLLDQTSLHEACWLIKYSCLHMDTETGLIRIAFATGAQALSMQGPSGTGFFAFDGVKPLISAFCHDCWWVKPDWMVKCLRGFERAECMYAVTPEIAAAAALEIIASRPLSIIEPAATAEWQEIEALMKAAQVIVSAELNQPPPFFIDRFKDVQNKMTLIAADFPGDDLPQLRQAGFRVRFGTSLNLPLAGGSVDLLIAPPTDDFYKQAEYARVLKPGGRLVYATGEKEAARVGVKRLAAS